VVELGLQALEGGQDMHQARLEAAEKQRQIRERVKARYGNCPGNLLEEIMEERTKDIENLIMGDAQ
jgi:hypothetical protein